MKLDKLSIKWKLYIYLIGFVAIMLGILWLFQIVSLERFYKGIKLQSIEKAANSLAKNIDYENLEELMEQLARQNDISIKIVDASGDTLSKVDIAPDVLLTHMSREDLANCYLITLLEGGTKLEIFGQDVDKREISPLDVMGLTKEEAMRMNKFPPPRRDKMESILYTKMVTRSDGLNVLLLLSTNITPIDATVDTLRVQLIYITGILVILAIGLALFISKKISKPIIEINHTAGELARGKYDIQFKGKGYLEIIELNNTLNYAASELSKVEKLRRELIANVSHDLKTPLTMITGYSEMMRDLPGENTPENVQIIIDEATRLNTLVNDLLDLSKLQAGTISLSLSKFNLTSSIREILKRYEKLTQQEGYQITFISDEEVIVYADEVKLSQVIYNLINNAITYTGKDKKIVVKQSRIGDDRIRIEIIDTGEGIEASEIPYIWERYYKVDKHHKRAAIGTGLGLSIVKNILECHESAYGLESTKGMGSTFWFELKELNRKS
nr:HAMP domain-containing sensor histidine kinase [uncultured Niameybacter sp.]